MFWCAWYIKVAFLAFHAKLKALPLKWAFWKVLRLCVPCMGSPRAFQYSVQEPKEAWSTMKQLSKFFVQDWPPSVI